MPLNPDQQQRVDAWLPGASLVEDLSWGLVDTCVLHLRGPEGDVVVKAGGPGNHHLGREITGHEDFTGPWLEDGRVGRLLHADRELNVLVLTHLPGVLADGTAAASDPGVHRQAGELLAAHGDWQPRNWLVHDARVLVIDLGRADWRPPLTDLARLSRQQWEGRPDLEEAFLDGYGDDPRDDDAWRRTLLREAIGTACWAFRVGDEAFEQQGHRMVEQALAIPG